MTENRKKNGKTFELYRSTFLIIISRASKSSSPFFHDSLHEFKSKTIMKFDAFRSPSVEDEASLVPIGILYESFQLRIKLGFLINQFLKSDIKT